MFTWGSNASNPEGKQDQSPAKSFPDLAVPTNDLPDPDTRNIEPTKVDTEVPIPKIETDLKAKAEVKAEPEPKGKAIASLETPAHVEAAPSGPEPYTLVDLLTSVVTTNSSDLHLHVGSAPVFRTGSKLTRVSGPALTREMARTMLLPLLRPEHMERFKATGQHDFSYELPNQARFRGHFFGQHYGLAAVFHRLPWEVPSLDDLQLPDVLKNICGLASGLIIATGPARSGRSTTIAAMIDHINHNRCEHVIILEEPVEHYHESDTCLIDHREIGLHVNTLSDGFRAVLHEQPDIVAMGDVKNREAAELALKAVESGMLVFATMGAASVVDAVERLVDLFPASHQKDSRAQVAVALKAVLAHHLFLSPHPALALEILTSNKAAARLIREGSLTGLKAIMETGQDEGMQSMPQAIDRLVQQGRLPATSTPV